MKKYLFKVSILGLALTFGLASCQSEYLNPSSASETQVVNDPNGLIALCNGLQYRFTVSRTSPIYASVTAAGLTTKSLTVLNAGNADEDFLQKGGANVTETNSVVRNLWEQSNLVKANADLILNNVSKVSDPALKAYITAHASIFKAISLGTIAQFFEKAPIKVAENAVFNTRQEVLQEAVSLLESSASAVASTTAPTTFTNRIVGGIDYVNTAYALAARYYLMLGNNDKALEMANKVDLSKKSEFKFDEQSRNPIFETALSNINVYQPMDLNMGLPASLAPNTADKRIDFYFTSRSAISGVFRGKGFFTANSASIPVYLPGEVSLIKAEAFARKSDLTNAVIELNKVLTKTTDVWGLGAGLSAYAGANTQEAVLTEIYRNRRIELFMSGLDLEDSRRFARPGFDKGASAERSRNYYPYPSTERLNNPSTPSNPDN